MTNDKNSIDLEKLSNSLKVIDQVNNNLNNMSISNSILELDNYLSKISFEHGNCFKDYKEEFDSIVSGIDKLKEEVNELDIALGKTINSFKEFEKTTFRREDLLNSAGEVTKIPEVDTNAEVTTASNGNKSINTIPIGLGIAASGIAGSVGAVIVDEMIPPDEKNPIPDYDEKEVEKPKKEVSINQPDEFLAREDKFEDVTPYHASRDKKIIDKFYDEEDK